MKKTAIVGMMIVMGSAWVACKKSKNSSPDPVIARGMSATINGTAWTATLNYMSNISFGNYVEITGFDSATGKTIDLRINNFKTRGTYTVPQANDSIFYSTDFGALATPTAATAGTITIQAVNDTAVGGTFSFTAGSNTVTNGTFYWNY